MKSSYAACFAIIICGVSQLAAQTQVTYTGTNATGQLVRVRTVNALEVAQNLPAALSIASFVGSETPPNILPRRLRPPTGFGIAAVAPPVVQPLPVLSTTGVVGFDGLSHLDQRLASNGNQFSTEPPNPAIAVGEGYVLAGVNNAIQVYNESGTPQLPRVLSSNQLYGVAPAINRVTGVNGVFPGDMRVFYDQIIRRWFVVQQAQDNDAAGNLLATSKLYIAVSQTSNPLGSYAIYTIDTTDGQTPGCPCFADFPQIGADQYGFYVSTNEFNSFGRFFVRAQIHAISKASLAAGENTPTMYRFTPPFASGFEFAIQPATTPPGASMFVGNNGVEFFVSTDWSFAVNDSTSVWAIENTASLATASPNLTLKRTVVQTIPYLVPPPAAQRPGPLPYGTSLNPLNVAAFIDTGDTRILSATYAGGRLFATFATQLTDSTGRISAGAGYVVLAPVLRSGVLSARVVHQGYVAAQGNHILYPAVGVNPQGRGAITFTLAGPDYYPSAAFVALDSFSAGTSIQLVRPGSAPEDGFTGYGAPGPGLARWGDYSGAVADSNGRVWMVTEYIPNTPRTEAANWGTHIFRYLP